MTRQGGAERTWGGTQVGRNVWKTLKKSQTNTGGQGSQYCKTQGNVRFTELLKPKIAITKSAIDNIPSLQKRRGKIFKSHVNAFIFSVCMVQNLFKFSASQFVTPSLILVECLLKCTLPQPYVNGKQLCKLSNLEYLEYLE